MTIEGPKPRQCCTLQGERVYFSIHNAQNYRIKVIEHVQELILQEIKPTLDRAGIQGTIDRLRVQS